MFFFKMLLDNYLTYYVLILLEVKLVARGYLKI